MTLEPLFVCADCQYLQANLTRMVRAGTNGAKFCALHEAQRKDLEATLKQLAAHA